MKILITGGAGFLGLHLTHRLNSSSNHLTLLDIASYEDPEYNNSRIQAVVGDIRDTKLVNKLMQNVDYVIHAAAALPLSTAKEIFSTNVDGTEILLKSALKHKVKKFIYISSTAVYGVPKKHPVYETDPMVGVGPYGHSKIQAEQKCETYRKKGLTVTIIRPKTFIGTHRLGVFEILYDWIHEGKKIPVLGNGQNQYQLLDVEDLTGAIEKVLTSKSTKKINDVFNVGAEKFTNVEKDLTSLFIYARSGSRVLKTPAFLIKKALFVFEKLGLSPLYQWVYDTADRDSFVSIEKIKDTLLWKPKYSNSQALIRSYAWYKKHYKEIKARGEGTTHTVGWKQGILKVFKKFL